jgi:hypothetical protein
MTERFFIGGPPFNWFADEHPEKTPTYRKMLYLKRLD